MPEAKITQKEEGSMEKYIEGNKAAWEEAFDNRDVSWGADIVERIQKEEYAFFNEDTKKVLQAIDTEGKKIGQFCCNNGRELLSLVKSGKASKGIGFDIAENQVFRKSKAVGKTGVSVKQLTDTAAFAVTVLSEIHFF